MRSQPTRQIIEKEVSMENDRRSPLLILQQATKGSPQADLRNEWSPGWRLFEFGGPSSAMSAFRYV
jgi:hypothetical protein